MADVLALVEARLRNALGEPDARAAVTFLGTDRVEVLRFRAGAEEPPAAGAPRAAGAGDGGADGLLRYATLGMSARPMAEPTASFADPVAGPRAELLLTVRAGLADTDKVLRALAVLAASPQVEGVVVAPGASLDLGAPLWPGAPFSSVLAGEPGGLVADLELDAPLDPVRFLPLLPMTPNEAAWKRVHGAAALQERWLRHGTDLRDPLRAPVRLDD
ncbi:MULTISPECIES: suppressor of fused domain protein [Streptomyces]|uniref:Suppressor of fused domain protein n=1 Tax=Streptomyces tsukubensis (strain DSM 42081 / NBRC 108919 / NRRL 18488 / 9993) TaxID=1114943 RepID=A0A7G3UB31_STRT9|nr:MULTISPECIES: suppressor of fused domain protein [Streptomyces]AZK96358.1 Suppressor of fused domain protein [Streptomyces tsukubensis]MYS63119.1 suppressor of fused domain protein [Streptomyces sp. SID5473]QKM67634.1 suppressor of fused domain protein [Streptomyces tsukubensis NRRL18488]TAI44032.1 suppressor of fused domain protein [Streptomyces tsukubensis]